MAGGGFTEERFTDAERGIELCFQTLGDPTDPPLLMVMGLGSQMIAWPDELCELLRAARPLCRPVRQPRLRALDGARRSRRAVADPRGRRRAPDPPYCSPTWPPTAPGCSTRSGSGPPHVCGASLGGFVSQTLAIERPERVRSLASIMSSSGAGAVGQPHPEALGVLMTRPPDDLDGFSTGRSPAAG